MNPMRPGEIRDGDLEQAERQAETMLAQIQQVEAGLDQIVGHGEAASGQVKVQATAHGRVVDVLFGPRAMRLDSRTLAEELLSAVGRAQLDAARQADDMMRETLDDFDPEEARHRIERLIRAPW